MLPDVLQPNLRLVICGTAAGDRSARFGAYYAGRGNQFWSTLYLVGMTSRQLHPKELLTLPTHGFGLTDIAKYRSGRDAMLNDSDFDVPAFRRKLEKFEPQIAAFNGKKAAAVFFGCETCDIRYGLQSNRVGKTVLWVLPSTSGGARGFWDLKPWKRLAKSLREAERGRSGSGVVNPCSREPDLTDNAFNPVNFSRQFGKGGVYSLNLRLGDFGQLRRSSTSSSAASWHASS